MTDFVELKHNGPEVERLLRFIPLQVERKAVPPAIKKTAEKTRTRIVRRLAQRVRVPIRIMRQQILKPKRTKNGLGQLIRGLVRGIRLSRLNPRKVGRGRGRGIRAGRLYFPHAFQVPGSSVFERETNNRLPIRKVVVQLEPMASQQMRITSRAMMRVEFPKQLRSQLDRFLNRRRRQRRN